MAVGQSHSPKYHFLDTTEKRQEWIFRILNKGLKEASALDEIEIGELFTKAEEMGYIHVNGNGPEITVKGIDYISSPEDQKVAPKSKEQRWVSLGEESFLQELSENEVPVPRISKLDEWSSRNYPLLKLVQANGMVATNGTIVDIAKELSGDDVTPLIITNGLRELNRHRLTEIIKEDEITRVEINSEGLATYQYLLDTYSKAAFHPETAEVGYGGLQILRLLCEGKNVIDDQYGWYFPESTDSVARELSQKISSSKWTIYNKIGQLHDRGYAELIVEEGLDRSYVRNIRITNFGLECLEYLEQVG